MRPAAKRSPTLTRRSAADGPPWLDRERYFALIVSSRTGWRAACEALLAFASKTLAFARVPRSLFAAWARISDVDIVFFDSAPDPLKWIEGEFLLERLPGLSRYLYVQYASPSPQLAFGSRGGLRLIEGARSANANDALQKHWRVTFAQIEAAMRGAKHVDLIRERQRVFGEPTAAPTKRAARKPAAPPAALVVGAVHRLMRRVSDLEEMTMEASDASTSWLILRAAEGIDDDGKLSSYSKDVVRRAQALLRSQGATAAAAFIAQPRAIDEAARAALDSGYEAVGRYMVAYAPAEVRKYARRDVH